MRRIQSACLLQTMKFDVTNDANAERDFEIFKEKLNKQNVKYVIDETSKEADGSIIVKIRKQYNSYSTDNYIE